MMMMTMMNVEVWVAVAILILTAVAYPVLWKGLWEPLRLGRVMAKQGVKGTPFQFLVGQFHEQKEFLESLPAVIPVDSYRALSPTVTPQYALYFPRFPGEKHFFYWWGNVTRFVTRDPDLAKEIFVKNHDSLRWAPSKSYLITQVFGKGLIVLVGQKWTNERHAINPFFHQETLKDMVEAMVEGTNTGIQEWEQIVAQAGGITEIDVDPDVHRISGHILSLTAFGGDFKIGEQIYKLQTQIAKEVFNIMRDVKSMLIPLFRKFPTKQQRHINQMVAKVDSLLREVIDSRLEDAARNGTSSYGNDLLGHMLAAANEGWEEDALEFNRASVFNNCKLFYLAGQDTVANATCFAMLMLALHPEWQERARKEVLEVVGDEERFNAGVLSRLRVMGMILNETMRLFTPGPTITRLVEKDLHLKNMFIPKGMTVEFAAGVVHLDKEYWGEDAGQFNPGRFANGVAGACSHPHAFNPFGLGPKLCIGNNFAVLEAKIILARVLRRFEILPSPNYKHYPVFVITTRPKFGLPIILKAR